MAAEKKYKSFWSFYPYYLTEHGDLTNRTLHFIGTAGLLCILVVAIVLQKWWNSQCWVPKGILSLW